MKKRVLLGMSGGMDSSVAAMLLKEKGLEVVGITFIFSGNEEESNYTVQEAKNLAKKIGIQHLTIELRKNFEDTVVQSFINEYKAGRTPFPCAYCNPRIKFFYLNQYAKELKCDFISTGHYAQIKKHQNTHWMRMLLQQLQQRKNKKTHQTKRTRQSES